MHLVIILAIILVILWPTILKKLLITAWAILPAWVMIVTGLWILAIPYLIITLPVAILSFWYGDDHDDKVQTFNKVATKAHVISEKPVKQWSETKVNWVLFAVCFTVAGLAILPHYLIK